MMTKNLIDQILELEEKLKVEKKDDKLFEEFARSLGKVTEFSCSIISFEDFEKLKRKEKIELEMIEEKADFLGDFRFHQLINARAIHPEYLKDYILSYNPRTQIRPSWEWVSSYYRDNKVMHVDKSGVDIIRGLGFLCELKTPEHIFCSASGVDSDDKKRVNEFIRKTFKKHGNYFYTFPDKEGEIETEYDKETKSQMAVIYLITKEIGDCLTSVSDNKQTFTIRVPGEDVGWRALFSFGGLSIQTCPFGVILYGIKPRRQIEGIMAIFNEYSKGI